MPHSLSNEDIANLYAVMLGMIREERQAIAQRKNDVDGVSPTPAYDWWATWAKHPSMERAAAVYAEEAKKLK